MKEIVFESFADANNFAKSVPSANLRRREGRFVVTLEVQDLPGNFNLTSGDGKGHKELSGDDSNENSNAEMLLRIKNLEEELAKNRECLIGLQNLVADINNKIRKTEISLAELEQTSGRVRQASESLTDDRKLKHSSCSLDAGQNLEIVAAEINCISDGGNFLERETSVDMEIPAKLLVRAILKDFNAIIKIEQQCTYADDEHFGKVVGVKYEKLIVEDGSVSFKHIPLAKAEYGSLYFHEQEFFTIAEKFFLTFRSPEEVKRDESSEFFKALNISPAVLYPSEIDFFVGYKKYLEAAAEGIPPDAKIGFVKIITRHKELAFDPGISRLIDLITKDGVGLTLEHFFALTSYLKSNQNNRKIIDLTDSCATYYLSHDPKIEFAKFFVVRTHALLDASQRLGAKDKAEMLLKAKEAAKSAAEIIGDYPNIAGNFWFSEKDGLWKYRDFWKGVFFEGDF